MQQSQRRAVHYFLSTTLLAYSWSAFGSSNEGVPARDRRGCGDYTILSDARDRAIFDRHCGTNEERDFKILLDSVNQLDPKREAHAAALRGDFRFAAVTAGGAEPPGTRLWSVEGLICKNINEADVAVFVRYSDVVLAPTHGTLQDNMMEFSKIYNLTLLNENGFPVERQCKLAKNVD